MAAEVVAAIKVVGLQIKVLFMDPVDDEALVNFATDLDGPHGEWTQASEIICSFVGRQVCIEGLWCRNVPCASSGTSTRVVAIPHETNEPIR